ncbi:DOUBLE-STRANDED RNA-BINDING PROTEIN 4 [Salix koriyanagi]|uniref:DOUBLE-STRANDED RNA-BINDING PROTEIN 4 n=1 Tax=Salix koriyanagi TaxID=2511006 RepID=A0A9Q0PGY4_9ROSI|nr:DOUBLE-STRANDED RNA-BINDING PROTEIN 4 [Salix koriyanagi]
MYKNRLQEYTQKSSLQLPVYQTFNEGAAHMPRFRSTVWVDGAQYTSQKTFLHRKAAEQDVANLALESILKRVKDEECPLLDAETVFCKSILNEFASEVILGDALGGNKKEAEQLAALNRDPCLFLGSRTLNHFKPNIVPVGVKVGHCSETTVDQEQEGLDLVSVSLSHGGVDAFLKLQVELHSPRLDPDPKPIPFPIAFEHPVSEQPLGVDYGSSSAKKRWKNNKNANEETDTQFPTDGIPLNQASPCSVAQ